MPQMPRVTVVMPVFNAEAYVPMAIRSILNQTFVEWELIVVNDGSSDRTCAIIFEFARQDSRIRVLHQANGGIAKARNAGWRAARGYYIAWLDADDIAMPDRLAIQVVFLDGAPEIGVLGGYCEEIDERGRQSGRIMKYPCSHEAILAGLPFYSPFAQSAVMMRRYLLEDCSGFRNCFGPAVDYDLWTRLSTLTRMANIPKVLCFYRYHSKSLSNTAISTHARAILAVPAAARCRREKGFDPTAEAEELGDDILKTLGITREMADCASAEAYRGRVSAMLLRGEVDAAASLLAQYETAEIPAHIRQWAAPEFAFLRARLAFARSQWLESILLAACTCWQHPPFLVSAAVKALRQYAKSKEQSKNRED